MFLYDRYVNGMRYQGWDMLYMTGAQFMGSFGMVMITLALQRGKGGIVQAIENLKVPWQVIIMIVGSGGAKLPTLLQWLGMLIGVAGATIIVCFQKAK